MNTRDQPEAWEWGRLDEKILESVALEAGGVGHVLWLLVGCFNKDTGTDLSLWPPVLKTRVMTTF